MPVYRLTASSIISSFRASGKRHLLLTGGRGTGKTTLLRALVPLLCPGTQEITTAAYPADRVEIRESVGGKIAVIGRFDPALPPGENRMRPVADGFLLLGVPALHRMAAGESEWAVLDELGYLENSCPEFRQAVEALLDAKRVLAIVRKQDTPFLTALCANATVLDRLTRYKRLEQYPDDRELLDDVIVEIRQAIEMTSIYRDDIKGTRELFSSILDNRLNNAMKYLTSITLLMAVPTVISGLYGMNVQSDGMPFANTTAGFAIVLGLTLALCVFAAWVLHKKHML